MIKVSYNLSHPHTAKMMDLWQPGNLTLINSTPFAWSRAHIHSTQMSSWDNAFPDSINPGDVVPVQIEFGTSGNQNEDQGGVEYSGQDDDGHPFTIEFQAQVNSQNDPTLLANFSGVSTFGNIAGSVYDMGWNAGTAAGLPFIFSGFNETATFSSTNPPTDWMHQNLPYIGCQPLRRLCMPGSHDSGMSELNGNTFGAIDANTLTQWVNVAGQLNAGHRYFDMRPVIHSGQFYDGHYSQIADVSWVGGNGQSLADVISQVNDFTSRNKELIILNLSHMVNTDDNYRSLSQDEFNSLVKQLSGLQHLFSSSATDIAALTLNDFIANGPAVVVLVDDSSVTLPSPPPTGLFPSSALNLYNAYADTDNLQQMTADQLKKMSDQRKSPNSNPFLLSWTLTTIADIRQTATLAHAALWDPSSGSFLKSIFGQPRGQAKSYPNVIYLDGIGATGTGIGHGNVAALAMAVNHWVLPGSCS